MHKHEREPQRLKIGRVAEEIGTSSANLQRWHRLGKLPEHLEPAGRTHLGRYWLPEQLPELRKWWPQRHRLTRAPKPPTARETARRLRAVVISYEREARERGALTETARQFADAGWELADKLTKLGDVHEADGLDEARALVESLELEQRAA